MKDVNELEITGSHKCYEVKSDRDRILHYSIKDMEMITWEHKINQRIFDELFIRAVAHFGDSHIERTGFPKRQLYGYIQRKKHALELNEPKLPEIFQNSMASYAFPL